MLFFFTNFPSLGTIFLGTSDPAVFTNVSPGTSQSNSITERLGKIYRDIRRNMMIRYNVKNVMRKTEYHVCFFSNAPSWNNPIQSNLESCISETTIIRLYLNVWYGIASLHGMAHYHMVLHGMVRYCMVLYGTVPLVQNGNNCTLSTNFIQPNAPNIFLNDGAIFFTLFFFVSFYRKIQACKIPPRYQF